MGAWGTGIFEDDTALDFLEELRSRDDPRSEMAEAFKLVEDGEYLEYDACCAILVSAAVIDAAVNGTKIDDDEETQSWMMRIRSLNYAELRAAAVVACHRVVEESELSELWQENEDDFPTWKEAINTVAARLVKAGA